MNIFLCQFSQIPAAPMGVPPPASFPRVDFTPSKQMAENFNPNLNKPNKQVQMRTTDQIGKFSNKTENLRLMVEMPRDRKTMQTKQNTEERKQMPMAMPIQQQQQVTF